MSRWTEADLRAFTQRRLKQEERTRAEIQHENHNPPQGPPAAEPERLERNALDDNAPRETPSSNGPASRASIRFIVRSRRPCDWDNLAVGIKPLQDLLVKGAGILVDDGWNLLQGSIVSEKATSAEDEGTTVIIERL